MQRTVMGETTIISDKSIDNRKETAVNIESLGPGELQVKFSCTPQVNEVKGDASVVVYVTNGRVVVHIYSEDNGKFRDDCLLIDGADIEILTEEVPGLKKIIKNWRNKS